MVNFTAREIRDIVISMLFISIIFAYIFSGGIINSNSFILLIPALLIAVGLGFVLHELAHKFVAVHYGFYAEFRMWFEGLIFALVTAVLLKFVFIAPGAVYIHGNNISTEENGKISIAGPLVNIVLAVIFFSLTPYVSHNATDLLGQSLQYIFAGLVFYGFLINSYLAVFNLIPLGIFDGAKVVKWNPYIWGITFLAAIYLAYHAYTLLHFV